MARTVDQIGTVRVGMSAVPAPRRIAPDVWFGLLGAALIACALAFAAFGTPPLPPAPMVVAGVPSPLTGLTRSFVALAGGHVVRAFAMHPLGPPCFLACLLAVVNLVRTRGTGRRLAIVDRLLLVPYAPWLVALAFAVVWVRQIVVFA